MSTLPGSERGWQGSWRTAYPMGADRGARRLAVQPANGGEVEFWQRSNGGRETWFVPTDAVRGQVRTGRVQIELHSNPTPLFLPVLGGFNKGGFSYWPVSGIPAGWQANWRGW